MHNTHVV